MRDYALLIFEPDIRGTFDHTTALWKGQIDSKKNYNSINLVLINDNIEINNRRPLSSWLKFLSDNSVKYEYIYNSEFAVSLRILDSFDKTFEFQLFCCDIRASNYKLEVSQDYIMALLYVLDLKKEGRLYPSVLVNKIKNAKLILEADRDRNYDTYDSMMKYLKSLEKLCENCFYYENDIHFYIEKN